MTQDLEQKLEELEKRGERFPTIPILEQLVEAEPTNEDYKLKLAVAYVDTGQMAKAESILRDSIDAAERKTASNSGLNLNIAANYGGRWDIVNAARQLAEQVAAGQLALDRIDDAAFASQLCLHGLPEPDLFIRTGGEQRVSNFLLWQLAYTELYFTDELWPDFDAKALARAFESYRSRERRFGRTSEQVSGTPPDGESGTSTH